MDKRVIFAVAGSGKTTYIINQLDTIKRCLIITYTLNNLENLHTAITSKFGYFPENIQLMSYFNFLYSFCFKPFLSEKIKENGIAWEPTKNTSVKESSLAYYLSSERLLYSNRLAKLLLCSDMPINIRARIEKYFDVLYIDEVQDFAGHDFNFLKQLAQTKVDIAFVGDFYQHTFDTSRDGSVNKTLHDDIDKYEKEFTNMGLIVDKTTLSKSHRCSQTVCDFIRDNLGIDIHSAATTATTVVKYIDSQTETEEIYNNPNIVKLFYQDSRKYSCFSQNWGNSKGENKYQDVCVVLNKGTLDSYKKNDLKSLATVTRNKFYVACSRAKNNLYLVPHTYYDGKRKKKTK